MAKVVTFEGYFPCLGDAFMDSYQIMFRFSNPLVCSTSYSLKKINNYYKIIRVHKMHKMKLPGNLRAINSILDFFYSRTIAGRRQAARGENIKRRSSGITTKSNSTTKVVLPVVTVPSASDTPLLKRESEQMSDQNTVANSY